MKYYYLISSLPTLSPDYRNNKFLNINELYEFISRNLAEQDLVIYNALLLQNDNRNLLSLIFHEYHDLKYENVHAPSTISFKKLIKYRRDPSDLPDYMTNFLLENAGIFSNNSLTDIELKLRGYFMKYIRELNIEFLLQYYEWQYQLEAAIADINQRSFAFLNPQRSHDIDYLESVPFSLPTIEIDKKQLSNELLPLMDAQNYAGINRLIDTYYWMFADSWIDNFSSETVYAYIVKLLRLSRWENVTMEAEQTKALFHELLKDIRTEKESPRMSMI